MNIFYFQDYREVIRTHLDSTPEKRKHSNLAKLIKIQVSTLSHVLKGSRSLTVEQGAMLASALNLSKLETRYLLTLIQLDRAGTEHLKKICRESLEDIRQQIGLGASPSDVELLPDEARSTFFSSWHYIGVWLAVSIPGLRNTNRISERLGLPKKLVEQVLAFLLLHKMCIKDESGEIRVGPRVVRLELDSPLSQRHLMNWRIKAIEHSPKAPASDLFYTKVVSLTQAQFEEMRTRLLDEAKRLQDCVVETDKPTTMACLNLDWFEMR